MYRVRPSLSPSLPPSLPPFIQISNLSFPFSPSLPLPPSFSLPPSLPKPLLRPGHGPRRQASRTAPPRLPPFLPPYLPPYLLLLRASRPPAGEHALPRSLPPSLPPALLLVWQSEAAAAFFFGYVLDIILVLFGAEWQEGGREGGREGRRGCRVKRCSSPCTHALLPSLPPSFPPSSLLHQVVYGTILPFNNIASSLLQVGEEGGKGGLEWRLGSEQKGWRAWVQRMKGGGLQNGVRGFEGERG